MTNENRYEKEMKIYCDGVKALKKERLYEQVLTDIVTTRDPTECVRLKKEAKKEKKWLMNTDYLALIKFKQLRIAKEERRKIPTSIDGRREAWKSLYSGWLDPVEPTKPVAKAKATSRNESTHDRVQLL